MSRVALLFLLWAFVALSAFAGIVPVDVVGRSSLQSSSHSRTNTSVEAARETVKDAIAKMTKLNKARVEKPARNQYMLKPGTVIGKREDETPPPLLNITPKVAQAAALVAEVDAASQKPDRKYSQDKFAGGSFWMKDIDRQGTVPWADDPDYKVSCLSD